MAPQIHEYFNEVAPGGPQPIREGRNVDTGGIGDAIAGFGREIGTVQKAQQQQQAQQETSSLIAQFSKLNADASVKLDQDTMDADEDKTKTLSDDFMDDYNDKLDELGSKLTTPEAQQAFEKMAANSRGQFLMASMHNQVSKTGQYAVDNYNDAVDSMSTQVRNDPSALPSVLAQHDQAIQALGQTHGLPQAKIDELQAQGEKQLNKAQFDGYLNLPNGGPQIAQNLLNKGQWDDQFNPDELQEMQKTAKTYIGAQQIDQNRRDKAAQDAANAKQESAMEDSLKKIYDNSLSTTDVLHNQDLDFDHQVTLLNMIKQRSKGDEATNPVVMKDLFSRVVAPDGSPNKITSNDQLNDEYIKGNISYTDLGRLRSELDGRKTDQGKIESDLKSGVLKVAEQALVKPSGLTGIPDPEGEQRLQGFRSWYLNEFEQQRKAGASVQELTTPGSPKYLGNMIKAFMPTAEQLQQSRFGSSSGQPAFEPPSVPTPLIKSSPASAPSSAASPRAVAPVPPRRSGESIGDYLKRTAQ
jgi:hypothetical protein